MKDKILELLDTHLGKLLLLLALIWGGLCLFYNRAEPLPSSLTDVKPRSVYVDLDSKAMSQASTETYYATGPAAKFTQAPPFVFAAEVVLKQFVPVELDIPPISIRRSPQILPDPGPSLEGAEKLPRFGEEFPPPAASEVAPVKPVKPIN